MNLPGRLAQGILARAALVLLRLYLGAVLLAAAVPALGRDVTPEIAAYLRPPAPQTAAGPVRRMALEHVEVVGAIAPYAALVVGLALVLGLLTRLAAAAALLLAFGALAARGTWPWLPGSGEATLAAVAAALLIGAAGRTLGLDAFLAHRRPRSPLW